MPSTITRRFALASSAATFALPGIVRAQSSSLEGRTITAIVPFPAGGSTDVVSRVIAERLGSAIKARIVVENRPGGGGSVGYQAFIKAPADGSVVMITSSAIATMPHLYPTRGYEPMRDTTPVSLIGASPSLVCVGPAVTAPDMAAFVAEAKRRPGEMTYASAGIGSGLHLSAELFKKLAGIDVRHVPYKGAALATGDLLGGRIDMIVDSLPSVRSLVDDGKLRALGISTPGRSKLAPTIPPVAETVPGYDYSAWFGLYLPAKAPAPLVQALAAAMASVVAQPDLQERVAVLGLELSGSPPAEFTAFMVADTERWGKLIRELGITADG